MIATASQLRALERGEIARLLAAACLYLADALERYARYDDTKRTWRGQDLLAGAINAYSMHRATLMRAAPRLKTKLEARLPPYSISWLYVNASDDELLDHMRALRGAPRLQLVELGGGVRSSAMIYDGEDGAVGYCLSLIPADPHETTNTKEPSR